MNEERTLIVGDEKILLEKITFREWRGLNPKTSKYIGYFSPDYPRGQYYKFPKRENLPKILKQIKLFCDQNFTFETKSFIRKISFIPCYIFSNLSLFKDEEIPKEILTWRDELKNILEKKDPSVLNFPINQLEHIFIDKKLERIGALKGSGLAFLNYWNLEIVAGRAKVGICSLSGCDRIFSQSRKDQEYCSEYCRGRSLMLRNKKKNLNKI